MPRYSDARILEELTACASRLGRSPTMREFAADPRCACTRRPWSSASAPGTPRSVEPGSFRGASPRTPSCSRSCATWAPSWAGADRAATSTSARARLPSKSLYWHRFGSLSNALREAGFDVPRRGERRERALRQGVGLARRLGRALPPSPTGGAPGRAQPELLSEWQVYRLFAQGRRRLGGLQSGGSSGGQLARRGACGRDRGEAGQRRTGPPRARARGKEGVLDEAAVGLEGVGPPHRAVGDSEQRPLSELPLPQADAGVALDEVERPRASTRRRARCGPPPTQSGRPMPRARKSVSSSRSSNHAAAIEPCSSSRLEGRLDASSTSAKIASESTVMPGSARSKPWPARISSSLAMMPLWMPTTAPCRMGWLLATRLGCPFV